MIIKAYNALDSLVMKGVNKAVKAWNWTTGGTKADLANAMLIYPVSGANLAYLINSANIYPVSVALTALILYHTSFIFPKVNREWEKREIEAAENGLKDHLVEYNTRFAKVCGPIMLTFTPGHLAEMSIPLEDQTRFTQYNTSQEAFQTVFFGLYGASFYIMRADNLPRQKSCVRRGYDSLVESMQKATLRPAPIPTR